MKEPVLRENATAKEREERLSRKLERREKEQMGAISHSPGWEGQAPGENRKLVTRKETFVLELLQ